MENQFVPYEIALKLKEFDFDEKCLGYWQGENSPCPNIMCHQGNIYVKDFNFQRNTFLGLEIDDQILNIPNESDFDKDIKENPEKFKRYKHGMKVAAPLFSQAIEWFRKVHGLNMYVEHHRGYINTYGYVIDSIKTNGFTSNKHNTYEEAQLMGLKKMLEYIEKK